MAASTGQSAKIHTIMVVDDSATEFHHMNLILARHGYNVIMASNGAEAVDLAAKHQPDLILMDVVMPGMNGFQATRIIARDQRTGHIPVVIISSKDQETDRIWGMRQGARAYLVKPVSEKTLLKAIDTVARADAD